MPALQYAKDKLNSTIALLIELQSTDFPYSGPLETLKELETLLKDQRKDIYGIDPDKIKQNVFNSEIRRTTYDVTIALEFAGYIINSSNTRNIFEVHSPLLRIAHQLIKHPEPVRLILSFEWNYVPFTYPLNVPELPNLVVIGLPASEAFNSLIIPAAGHELGHSIWNVENYEDEFKEKVELHIINLIQTTFWETYTLIYPNVSKEKIKDKETHSTRTLLYTWTMLHLQELFCDIIGLGIFGEAYLHAFKYLIAPTLSDYRPETYPASKQRAEYLAETAESLTIPVPTDFVTSFKNEPPEIDAPHYRLLLDISDRCTSDCFKDIRKKAINLLKQRKYKIPTCDRWKNITTEFRKFVPVSGAPGFAEIINAGWEVYHDYDGFLPEDPDGKPSGAKSELLLEDLILDDRRLVMINELVLKSVEIYEIEFKLREAKKRENS